MVYGRRMAAMAASTRARSRAALASSSADTAEAKRQPLHLPPLPHDVLRSYFFSSFIPKEDFLLASVKIRFFAVPANTRADGLTLS